MNYETIIFEVQDHIATITLNRPEQLNAWNATMMRELGRAMLRWIMGGPFDLPPPQLTHLVEVAFVFLHQVRIP